LRSLDIAIVPSDLPIPIGVSSSRNYGWFVAVNWRHGFIYFTAIKKKMALHQFHWDFSLAARQSSDSKLPART